jgi:hypothetical protein
MGPRRAGGDGRGPRAANYSAALDGGDHDLFPRGTALIPFSGPLFFGPAGPDRGARRDSKHVPGTPIHRAGFFGREFGEPDENAARPISADSNFQSGPSLPPSRLSGARAHTAAGPAFPAGARPRRFINIDIDMARVRI